MSNAECTNAEILSTVNCGLIGTVESARSLNIAGVVITIVALLFGPPTLRATSIGEEW